MNCSFSKSHWQVSLFVVILRTQIIQRPEELFEICCFQTNEKMSSSHLKGEKMTGKWTSTKVINNARLAQMLINMVTKLMLCATNCSNYHDCLTSMHIHTFVLPYACVHVYIDKQMHTLDASNPCLALTRPSISCSLHFPLIFFGLLDIRHEPKYRSLYMSG